MKKNVTFEAIRQQLTTIFASSEKTATYNSMSEQYVMFCGWCGTNSPISRPAFIKEFGEATTMEAEAAALSALNKWRQDFAASDWAAYKAEADQHEEEGQKVPTVGAFVWGVASFLKCDGGKGYLEEIKNQEILINDGGSVRPTSVLLHIGKVVTVTAEEFNRPSLADELAEAGDMPGGGTYEEDEHMKLVAPYHLSCSYVAVVTDGARFFYIDTEGYNYARYIMFPKNWRTMFASELEAYRKKTAEEEAAREQEKKEEHAQALAAYKGRCKKWEKLMQPVTELEKQLHGAKYGTVEYKATSRKLCAVRRANILAMCRAAFPGMAFSLKQEKGWGESWSLTYTDGPTEDAFAEAVDLDLFTTHYDTFDGFDDSSDVVYINEDFTVFARKYMGSDCNKGVKVERKMSDTTRDELRARVLQTVPGFSEKTYLHRDALTDEQRNAIDSLVGSDYCRVWAFPEGLAREMFDALDLYTRPEKKSPKTETTASQAVPAKTDGQQLCGAASVVLTSEEYSEKAIVVRGYTELQYHDLVNMGGKYNRRLKGGAGIVFSTKKHGEAVAEYITAHTV